MLFPLNAVDVLRCFLVLFRFRRAVCKWQCSPGITKQPTISEIKKKELFSLITVSWTNILLLIAIAMINLDAFIGIAVNLPAFSFSIPEFQRKLSAQS